MGLFGGKRAAPALVDGELATITGKVRAARTLVAPLSGRPCVAFQAAARLHGEALVERELVPFELAYRDRIVIVDGTAAHLALPNVPLIPRRLDRELAFLARHGQNIALARSAGFDEAIVGDGDTVSVHGMVVVEIEQAAAAYRDGPTRVRIVAHEHHPLTIGKPR